MQISSIHQKIFFTSVKFTHHAKSITSCRIFWLHWKIFYYVRQVLILTGKIFITSCKTALAVILLHHARFYYIMQDHTHLCKVFASWWSCYIMQISITSCRPSHRSSLGISVGSDFGMPWTCCWYFCCSRLSCLLCSWLRQLLSCLACGILVPQLSSSIVRKITTGAQGNPSIHF